MAGIQHTDRRTRALPPLRLASFVGLERHHFRTRTTITDTTIGASLFPPLVELALPRAWVVFIGMLGAEVLVRAVRGFPGPRGRALALFVASGELIASWQPHRS